MTKAVFLDRDGVINKKARAHDYIKTVAEFELLPGAAKGIQILNNAGFLVIVVTNQRGVARGMLSLDDLNDVHQSMHDALALHGAAIDAIYVCPHEEGECDCRKPKPGLVLKAMTEYAVESSESWMIGDSETDVKAGKAAGLNTILVGSAAETCADYSCKNLLEASNFIIDGSKR